jgi:endonuclease-8
LATSGPDVPEGDTILRTATTLRRWLEGREVTGAESKVAGLATAGRLVGTTVTGVEARGKHLLVRFSSGQVLHTHMRMTGSWHVYPAGERWRRPAWQARLVLACGERVAVCFNAPVVELLAAGDERSQPALAGLGPDVLSPELDLAEVQRRAAARPGAVTVGELLLDQTVVAGIGNIYRCESLFLRGHNPWVRRDQLDDGALGALIGTAARLMGDNVRAGTVATRSFGPGTRQPWVYRRSGRPCRRCGTTIASGRLGEQARSVYWCPACQPAPVEPARPEVAGTEPSRTVSRRGDGA